MKNAEHTLPPDCAYRMVRRLGSGGESTVYLVCHLPTEQFRAAKVFTDIERDCRREWRMLKRLRHPSLPQIMDVLEQPGQFWLIMEYIEGKQLEQFTGCLTDEALFRIAEQLSGVLCYLHSRREPVYHLDIKPSNILIRADGSLALIDFGASIRGHPGSGSGYGTPGFAAPEQMCEGAVVDGRTDLFGFGAVIYYCRYGTVPNDGFCGDSGWKTLWSRYCCSKGKAQNISDFFRSVTQSVYTILKTFQKTKIPCIIGKRKQKNVHAGIGSGDRCRRERRFPPELAGIVCKCLERDPDSRFSDSRQLHEAVCRAHRQYRRRRQLGQAAGAAILLTSVLCFFFLTVRTEIGGATLEKQTKVSESTAAGADFTEGKSIEATLEDVKDIIAETVQSDQAESGQEDSTSGELLQSDVGEQRYWLLLDQADGAGLDQAMECFGQAATLCPGDVSWYLRVIDWVETDGRFDAQEEEAVQTLLFAADEDGVTRLNCLKENAIWYGEVSWRFGLAYWYFYDGSGGKSAAARWFEQAVSAAEAENVQADWAADARIHARISSYYGVLGRTDEEETRLQKEWEYWQDLQELWNLQAPERDSRISRNIAEELLYRMILDAAQLRDRGETEEHALELLESLRGFLTVPSQDSDTEAVLVRLRALCEDADASIRRAFS